jgi:hypothetical protein
MQLHQKVQATSLHEFSEFIFADAHTNQFSNRLGDWHFSVIKLCSLYTNKHNTM